MKTTIINEIFIQPISELIHYIKGFFTMIKDLFLLKDLNVDTITYKYIVIYLMSLIMVAGF